MPDTVRKTGWKPKEVHPAAEVFPMMPADEITALAADIKEHGLLHPIVIDADGALIDGRNRLAACVIAGVEPTYAQLNGSDPLAFIASANLNRRNLTKGQQAMAMAMIYPEPDKRGRGNKGKAEETSDFSQKRLSQARSILRHSRALALDVMAKHKSVDEALKIVADQENAAASVDARMAELRAKAPDLAEMVDEERLPLSEAYAAMERRVADAERLEHSRRETMFRVSESAWNATTAWASEEFVAGVKERLNDDDFRGAWLERVRLDPARIAEFQRGAEAFAGLLGHILKRA